MIFPPGVLSVELMVPIIDDEIVESPEVFLLELQDPSTRTLSPTTATATGTIIDDDSKKGLLQKLKHTMCMYASYGVLHN